MAIAKFYHPLANDILLRFIVAIFDSANPSDANAPRRSMSVTSKWARSFLVFSPIKESASFGCMAPQFFLRSFLTLACLLWFA
jgi:hypothetical protein